MPLTGYPKTYNHPDMHVLQETGTTTLSDGTYMLIKSMGADGSNWIEYKVKLQNSANPNQMYTVRTKVGDSLHGPFSYIKHNDEGTEVSGTINATAVDAYSLVYEVED